MSQPPEQLSLDIAAGAAQGDRPAPGGAPAPRAGRGRRQAAQLDLALREPRVVAVIEGGGGGSGHRLARLVAIEGGAAPRRPLPSREEITAALLGALADLVAGRMSAAAASAIREAAEETLRQLEAAERDPHRTPQFVRAARALQELLPARR